MRQISFKLQDKTIILSGTFNHQMQNMATTLTSLGADVALIGPSAQEARRFCDNLNDAREINSSFGRSLVIESSLDSESSVQEAVSRTAESFGGLDALIDSRMLSRHPKSFSQSSSQEMMETFQDVLHSTLLITQMALQFIEGRQKGRVIFVLHDSWRWALPGEELSSVFRSCLQQLTKTLAQEITEKNITVNALAVGVTEEFLLQRYPKSGSAELALKELKAHCPSARMVDAQDISHLVAFLASPLSSAINGQVLTAHGGWI